MRVGLEHNSAVQYHIREREFLFAGEIHWYKTLTFNVNVVVTKSLN